MSALSHVFEAPRTEDEVSAAVGGVRDGWRSLFRRKPSAPVVMQFLQHLRVGHRILHNHQVDLDAFLNTGRAVVMLFEQYRCQYIDRGVIRRVRMAVGSQSFHTVIVVARSDDGYLLFDPGWIRGGWQWMTEEVMKAALNDSLTSLVGVDSDDGIDKKVRPDGLLLVNRNTGRWEFHPEESDAALEKLDLDSLSTYQQNYDTIGNEVSPHQYIVNVTNRCSLACLYCYAESPAPKALAKDMSVEVFRAIWQLADRVNGNRESSIVLHGGEPMLVFDTMLPEMRRARTHNPNIKFALQTNGIGITEERLKAIQELDIKVGFSLDGPEELNNPQRGNYMGTMCGIELLRAAGRKTPILITLTKSICAEMERVIDHFVDHELYDLAFSPMIASGIGKRHPHLAPTGKEYGDALVKAWRRLLAHRKAGKPVQIRELSRYIMHLSSNIRPALCGRTSCGAGKALLGVDVDGSVYACDMFMGHDEMIVGNVADLELAAVETHLMTHELYVHDRVETVEPCSTCRWEKVCSRGCPANNYLTENMGKKSLFCDAFDKIHEELAVSLTVEPGAQSYLQDVALKNLLEAGILVEE